MRESQARRCNYFVLITEPPTDARDYIYFHLALIGFRAPLANHFGWLCSSWPCSVPPALSFLHSTLPFSALHLVPRGCFVTATMVGTPPALTAEGLGVRAPCNVWGGFHRWNCPSLSAILENLSAGPGFATVAFLPSWAV